MPIVRVSLVPINDDLMALSKASNDVKTHLLHHATLHRALQPELIH